MSLCVINNDGSAKGSALHINDSCVYMYGCTVKGGLVSGIFAIDSEVILTYCTVSYLFRYMLHIH